MDISVGNSVDVLEREHVTVGATGTMEAEPIHGGKQSPANTMHVSVTGGDPPAVSVHARESDVASRARLASEEHALLEEKRREQELRLKQLKFEAAEPKDSAALLTKLQRQTEACRWSTI